MKEQKQLTLTCLQGLLQVEIQQADTVWRSTATPCYMVHEQHGKILLESAKEQLCRPITTGIGHGYEMILSAFPQSFIKLQLQALIVSATNEIHMSLSVLVEDEEIHEIYWPSALSFDQPKQSWYTLLPVQQGLLIPNTWEHEVHKLPFDGQFCTSSAYMPWFSQIKDGKGYLAIALDPWDSGYQIEHPAKGPYTHVAIRWLSSLSKFRYTRTLRYQFVEQATHTSICKLYQQYAKEVGYYTTLKEKAIRNESIHQLKGSMFVHKGIKTYVCEDSTFYDAQAPEKNNSLTTFDQRIKQLHTYHALGVKKLYLHLDGWAQPGYDNNHPDYFPVCKEAGGTKGLRQLHETMHSFGYLLGLHDQYRDFYHKAESYDDTLAVHSRDGSIYTHQRWAGGKQSYLCSAIAPAFVKRNFQRLFEEGIHPEASYLDVFTCNEPDECFHPSHRITRKESLAYREQCFSYLESQKILSSSEEACEWAIRHLVFAHYGPYESMMHAPDQPRLGIDVPLFNLVYHACMILPWPMEKIKGQDDQMLFALLNGGAPYLEKDGAYPNTDGVFFDTYENLSLEEKVQRSTIVAALHEQVAYCDMIAHEFIDNDPMLQKTVFEDGTTVRIDLYHQTYQIEKI